MRVYVYLGVSWCVCMCGFVCCGRGLFISVLCVPVICMHVCKHIWLCVFVCACVVLCDPLMYLRAFGENLCVRFLVWCFVFSCTSFVHICVCVHPAVLVCVQCLGMIECVRMCVHACMCACVYLHVCMCMHGLR